MKYAFLLLLSPVLLFNNNNTDKATNSITEQDVAENIKILSSDEFLGRQPSTAGEEKTITFLKNEFEKLGLKPGNNGSYFQEVPLVEVRTESPEAVSVKGEGTETSLRYGLEYVSIAPHLRKETTVEDAELVFAGYGIVAPEFKWNDYNNLDIKNKIAVVLENDPGSADSSLFNGSAMTYYGRWNYKYEEAARQGAAGVLIIHEPAFSAYPWEAIRNIFENPRFYPVSNDSNLSNCKFEGWITSQVADKIFAKAGLNYKETVSLAPKQSFKAIPMDLTLSIHLKNSFRESVSNNVLALWEGSERKDEFIIYTAHWDHLGMNPAVKEEDKIFNGAVDNATGTAALIEIAEAFTKLPERPKRSVLFLAVTAEEQGLLGSEYYVRNPVYPLKKTAAVINMDVMNVLGRVKDIRIVGYGKSELDNYLKESAAEFNRVAKPDPWPQRGAYYRSDQFSFAKQGVPSLFTQVGIEHVEKGEQWMSGQIFSWIQNNYHKTNDEYDPSWWDLSGLIDDVKILFGTGYKLAMEDKFPQWYEGSEFKAKRDLMMRND